MCSCVPGPASSIPGDIAVALAAGRRERNRERDGLTHTHNGLTALFSGYAYSYITQKILFMPEGLKLYMCDIRTPHIPT